MPRSGCCKLRGAKRQPPSGNWSWRCNRRISRPPTRVANTMPSTQQIALWPESWNAAGTRRCKGTVQRSGGSSRLRQLWAWRGDWIEHTTEPGAEHAVVDRATDLKKQIGASPRPSHLLRFIHSPVDQEIRGTFGN